MKIGDRFNRLIVLEILGRKNNHRQVRVGCDCGTEKIVSSNHLKRQLTKSCGCFRSEVTTALSTKHNYAHAGDLAPEYIAWIGLKQRCLNPGTTYFENYGGRGITVCDEWLNDFEAFLAHVGRRPSPKHTIDRYPDNNGNYEPGNVRWATRKEQEANKRPRRDTIYLTHNGKTQPVFDWARELNLNYQTLRWRVKNTSWPIERMLSR